MGGISVAPAPTRRTVMVKTLPRPSSVGTPVLDKASVTAKIKAQGRGDKVEIIKFRRRKHSRKQMGHRQSYTEIEVTEIKA